MQAAKLFYCYAHEDKSLQDQLVKQLASLERLGLIAGWSDRDISAGQQWQNEIDKRLNTADIILLLISPDFIASNYCYSVEMKRAMERYEAGEARVIPIILRSVYWQKMPFGQLQALPAEGKPIDTWRNRNEAFLDVVQGIKTVLEELTIASSSSDTSVLQHDSITLNQQPSSPSSHPANQYHSTTGMAPSEPRNIDRMNFLKRLRKRYAAYRQDRLRGTDPITLGLHTRPDAISSPMDREFPDLDQEKCILPSGTSIDQVFEEAIDGLLILGEAGAGKTTLLLDLAFTLLKRAEQDMQQYIPVIFHLSSWTTKHQPLVEWVVEGLYKNYGVSRKLGQQWIQSGQILPLLDGLDEVADRARPDCVNAINFFRREHSLPLVVCSREAEYFAQQRRLEFQSAVIIQQLTQEQVDSSLLNGNPALQAIHVAIQKSPNLQQLITSPLMLNVIIRTYQDTSADALPTRGSVQQLRQQIFEKYIQHAFKKKRRFSPERTKKWLIWLAQQMRQYNLATFYLEQMQPDWLPSPFSRLHHSVINGLSFGFLIGLAHFVIYITTWWVLPDLSMKFMVALIMALFWGGFWGLLSLGDFQPRDAISQTASPTFLARLVPPRTTLWRITELLVGLLNGLITGWMISRFDSSGNDLPFLYGVIYTLAFWFCFEIFGPIEREIKLAEVATWSWKGASRSARLALGFGLVASPFFCSLEESFSLGANGSTATYLTFLLIGTVTFIGTLLGGFSGKREEIEEIKKLAHPNQGVHDSLYNCSLFGIITGLAVGLCAEFAMGFPFYPSMPQSSNLFWPIYYGLCCGVLSASFASLRNGGVACLQHGLLRLLLWWTGKMPLNSVAFLDEAARRALLYKDGSGYAFIHGTLLEYFAAGCSPSTLSANEEMSEEEVAPAQINEELSAQADDSTPVFSSPPVQSDSQSTKSHRRRMRLSLIGIGVVLFVIIIANITPVLTTEYQINVVNVNNRNATATSIPQQSPYTNKKTSLAYYDPLNQPYLWSPSVLDSYGGRWCDFTQNAYHVNLLPGTYFPLCVAKQDSKPLTLSNFVFEVQMQILTPGGCGLVMFRANIKNDREGFFSPGDNGYSVGICEDKSYAFLQDRSDDNEYFALVYGDHKSSTIRPGVRQMNTLALVADQSTITIFVNGNKLMSTSNKNYTSGSLALTATVWSGGATVAYQNAKIWTLG